MDTSTQHIDHQVSDLDSIFQLQRDAFRRQPNPPAGERRAHLDAVCRLLLEHGDAIAAAIDADFGHRSVHETRILEIFPALQTAKHARAHVAKWMRPERKSVSVWFMPGRARVVKQPLGVVGIIVPWNYPLYLAVGPLVSALAAGNRVMVKMSEFTPRLGELFAQLIGSYFAPDHVAVVNGGVEVAQAFAAKPFDHLLFTGSTSVGRQIMRAAAENLTPVTLELGGKSPAIIAPDFPVDVAARRIIWGKCLNAGQTCIAPDYVLLPEAEVQRLHRLGARRGPAVLPRGRRERRLQRHHQCPPLQPLAGIPGGRAGEGCAGCGTGGRRVPIDAQAPADHCHRGQRRYACHAGRDLRSAAAAGALPPSRRGARLRGRSSAPARHVLLRLRSGAHRARAA